MLSKILFELKSLIACLEACSRISWVLLYQALPRSKPPVKLGSKKLMDGPRPHIRNSPRPTSALECHAGANLTSEHRYKNDLLHQSLLRKLLAAMKAYRYDCETFKLHVADVPIPTPGAGQALIRVEAAGLCHSDTNLLKGVVRLPHKQPITLGHEVAGTIIQLGPERAPHGTSAWNSPPTPQPSSSFKPGDRIAVAQVAHPLSPLNWVASIGLGHDGGYAPFALAHVDRLVPIPPGVSFAQAASATDAISTAYHAIATTGAVGPGMTVGVIGLGGLGMSGLHVAALRGAAVYGVDVNVGKFGEARAKGAVACAASIKEFKDVVFDVVVDFVGVTVTTRSAIDAVREGGTVVLVGLGESSVRIPSARMVSKGVALLGSIGASLGDLKEVLGLIEEGRLKPTLIEVPFGEVETALWSLDRNEVAGRLYTCPGKESSVLKSNL